MKVIETTKKEYVCERCGLKSTNPTEITDCENRHKADDEFRSKHAPEFNRFDIVKFKDKIWRISEVEINSSSYNGPYYQYGITRDDETDEDSEMRIYYVKANALQLVATAKKAREIEEKLEKLLEEELGVNLYDFYNVT
jgi:hypothetical protein